MSAGDLAAELVGFARTLPAVGIAVDPERVAAAADAVSRFGSVGVREIYWSTRLTFCSQRDDIDRFDLAFDTWFGVPAEPDRQVGEASDILAAPATEDGADGDGSAPPDTAPTGAGALELLMQRDFKKLDTVERDQINALIALLDPFRSTWRSRRRTPGGRERIDPVRTVRATLRNYAEPAELRYRHRTEKPRRLVLLVDVSGSMDGYSEVLLRFAHAAVRAAPATTEAFALGTRLTRLTPALRQRAPDAAIDAVASLETDWGGGTCLGRTMRDFLRVWGGRRTVRSAVAVIASDGWDSEDAGLLLPDQVARLRRLAHRVVWVNPLKGQPGYAPLLELKRSLRFVDEHVPGHNFAALESLAQLIARM